MLPDQEKIFKQRALCLGGGYLAFPTAGCACLHACVHAYVCVLLTLYQHWLFGHILIPGVFTQMVEWRY